MNSHHTVEPLAKVNITLHQWISYWRLAWRHRPPSQLYAPYRAIPSIAIATVAFFIRRFKDHRTSPNEMLAAVYIAIAVFLSLYLMHALFNFLSLAPVLMDAKGIGILDRQQERRLESVRELLTNFTLEEQAVLKFVLDFGVVGHANILAAGFKSPAMSDALRKGKGLALITETHEPAHGRLEEMIVPRGMPMFRLNPVLELALSKLLE
jgi:hypothetical protein